MAEAKNITFQSIMHDLQERKFVPLYYLVGDEPYYIDKIADYIAEHVLQPEERDFNHDVRISGDHRERSAEYQEYRGFGEVYQSAHELNHPRDVPEKCQN